MSKTDREIIWEILEFKKGLKWVTIPDVIDTLQAAREDERARLREVVEKRIDRARKILESLGSDKIVTIRDTNCIILTLMDILGELK